MNRWSILPIAWALALLLAGSSIAQERMDLQALREQRDEEVERYFVRALTQKRLAAAGEYLENAQYAEIFDKFEKINLKRLNKYERALAYRMLAYAALGQGDSASAARYFEKVVEQQALPIDEEASVRFNVAQIYASLDEWEKVDTTLVEWFRYVERPNGVAYYLLAIARYRRDLSDAALAPALMALEVSDEPKEGWLQLVTALYLEKEDYESAVPILEELVIRFTKKKYWIQLSLIYGARGDYEYAMRVQQLAYAQGLLTEGDELRRLARTYLFHQLPYSAAEVLERGLEEGRIEPDREVLELLGNSWIAAREYERSMEPLQRAAELADDGRLYLRLGQVRVQRENWKEATALIRKAIKKGGLEDEGKAHLLLGISHYSEDNQASARTAFQRAKRHESTRADANTWLEHIARQSQDG